MIGVDLSGANLSGAELGRANLNEANMVGTTLSMAYLRGADLRGANASKANLSSADLTEATLCGTRLLRANLDGAKLGSANLDSTDLGSANLRDTNLRGAYYSSYTRWPAPTMLLLASWGRVSYELCRDLMNFDAANHPNPEAFDVWAESPSGPCPYDDTPFRRSANFHEDRELWEPGPAPRALELVERLLQEKLTYV